MGPEAKIENKLRNWVKAKGGICVQFESSSRNGVSDRLVILPGLGTILVELKSEHGRLSAEQELWMNDVNNSGGIAVVMKGEHALEKFIKKYEEQIDDIKKNIQRLDAKHCATKLNNIMGFLHTK